MKDEVTKQPKGCKRQRDELLRKLTELKGVGEVDVSQWMEERFERIIKCFQKRKAERDRNSG